MFRLAALYEERARTDLDASEEVARGLRPAIALYKRIIVEFPGYRELAGVYYYLGHAYDDANRAAEAQQVFRSLVCHDRYPYPAAADPRDPARDAVAPLPQDHDRAYWQAWDVKRDGKRDAKRGGPKARARAAGEDDGTFEDPFPDTCQPVAQVTPAGQEPRYLAEAWWLIGDYHFNETDPAGGPYNLNRAESAYRNALRYRRPPVYGVALYKHAWTLFKQQRYEASVRQFVVLLRYADEEEKRTGDPGADFRAEAYTYIAGALTYVDFAGPAPEEPYAARRDVLDTEPSPRVAEQRMRVAIDRVRDPRLVPQDRKWTVPIYRALAAEMRELGQLHNAIEVSELVLKKAPLHRDAPVVQSDVADAWEKLAAISREGTSDRAEATARALAARTALSAYVGVTPWVEANKDDPEAIRAAERLSRGGLRRAAADHTNAGNALLEKARAFSDEGGRNPLLEQALAEYRMAAQAWGALPAQDEAYEQRYWLADANHQIVVIEVALGRSPAASEVDAARRSATLVRDSNEDDRYLQPAAWMVVDVAQQVLADRYALFGRTGGREGIEPREQVKTTGAGASERVVTEPFPREVADAIAAREEYRERVPAARDFGNDGALYAYQIADFHFLYGQLDEAKKRFEAQHRSACGKTSFGVKAWRRLLTIAEISHDVEGVRALAQGALDRSCATSDDERGVECELGRKALGAASYEDAKTAFVRAQKMPDGPERSAAWRRAAALYRVTLEKAPDGDAAPEAAINGAYAYKQVGDYDQAIAVYGQFIEAYGSEERLGRLERGDASTSPPKPPDPARYAERVRFLRQAHEALAAAHVSLFDLRRAGASYDAIARNRRFEAPARREAARNAAMLYGDLGDKERMAAARTTFLGLDPPAEQKAEIDWLVAAAELGAWDERGLDENGNRAARLKAIATMEAYHAASKGEPAAAVYAVRAAYQSARLRRAGHDGHADAWCRSTVTAFEKLRAAAPVVEGKSKALGSAEADMAAECAYTLLDDRIKAELDVDARPAALRGGDRQGGGRVRRRPEEGGGLAPEAPGRDRALPVGDLVRRGAGPPGVALRRRSHGPLLHAGAGPRALHRPGEEAAHAARRVDPGQERGDRRVRAEAQGGLASGARQGARRRGSGDDPALRGGRPPRPGAAGAAPDRRRGDPAAGGLHQPARRRAPAPVHPGHRRPGDAAALRVHRRRLPQDAARDGDGLGRRRAPRAAARHALSPSRAPERPGPGLRRLLPPPFSIASSSASTAFTRGSVGSIACALRYASRASLSCPDCASALPRLIHALASRSSSLSASR